TLTGAPSTAGAIDFALYAHPDCTQLVFSGKASENGDGTYEPNNGPYQITAPGTYYWTAKWNGGGTSQPVSSPCASETVNVSPALTALTTTPSPGSATVGSVVKDTASLTGGFSPSGSITFKLYPTSDCSANPVDTETVGVSGNNGYQTPTGYTPVVTGVYQWVASYSGDANNAPATSACGSEQVTVGAASPTLTTTPQPSSGLSGT